MGSCIHSGSTSGTRAHHARIPRGRHAMMMMPVVVLVMMLVMLVMMLVMTLMVMLMVLVAVTMLGIKLRQELGRRWPNRELLAGL